MKRKMKKYLALKVSTANNEVGNEEDEEATLLSRELIRFLIRERKV